MRSSLRTALGLGILLIACWCLASWIRLQALHGTTAGSDTLGQYLAGLSLGRGAWPSPPNPEGGHSLWLTVWPLTQWAHSLEHLFQLRFILGATVAPLAAASAWLLSPKGTTRWVAGTLAGLLLALDPGLVDTLVISFRGYGAPEWVGLATLLGALSLKGHRWALPGAGIALLGAAGQHPMATGMILGGLCALPWFAQRSGRRSVEWAVGVCAIVALPRLYIIRQQSDCGQPALECLSTVALGSSEPDMDTSGILTRAFHDRFSVELLDLWPLYFIGLLAMMLPLERWSNRTTWAHISLTPISEYRFALLSFSLGGLLGILMLGSSIDSLRPYHLRIVAVPLAVTASIGLARLWPLAVVVGGWVWLSWFGLQILPPSLVTPQTFDHLAAKLEPIPGPIWVDSAYLDSPIGLDPSAVVLSAVLQGQDADRFEVGLESTVVLLVNGSPQNPVLSPGSELLEQGENWLMIQFPDPVVARQWLAQQQTPASPTGGAWDWWKVLQPTEADLAETAW